MFNCEEIFCDNFQTATCLHCMRRLCICHIEDHQKLLLNQIDQLKNEVNQVNIVLTNASNVIVEEYKADQNKCNDWRQEKLDEVERDYNEMINSINNRRKTLEQLEVELHQRLKVEIEQPLEYMSIQKSINPHLLDHIQSVIKTIRENSAFLTWNSQYSDNSNSCKEGEKEATLSTLPKVKGPKKNQMKVWKPRNYMFSFFRDVGRHSAHRIHEFLQTMTGEDKMENSGLIMLVFSYVQTWYQTKTRRDKYQRLILTKHILTIKQYVIEKDSQRKVLIGLEFFFNNLKHQRELEVEMMTMLLQLFFDYQCISTSEMIDWYLNDNSINEMIRRNVDKKWSQPFLNLHGYQIKSPNPLTNEMGNTSSSSSEALSINAQNDSTNLRTVEYVRIRKPFKNLVKFFKDQSDTHDIIIHQYIQIQYSRNIDHRVIMIVRCYLKAWNECLLNEKNEFLMRNLMIIEYYKSDRNFEMQIIFAIEIFLAQNKQKGNRSIETISTLFQLFLDQDCIKKETFIKWNSDGHLYKNTYYKEAKRFAQPFIQRLITYD